MLMPFGKYVNRPVEDLPTQYLKWLLGIELESPGLRAAIARELRFRDNSNVPSVPCHPYPSFIFRIPADPLSEFIEIAECGYKTAALKAHPDKGGEPLHMVRLNTLIGLLRESLRELKEGRS